MADKEKAKRRGLCFSIEVTFDQRGICEILGNRHRRIVTTKTAATGLRFNWSWSPWCPTLLKATKTCITSKTYYDIFYSSSHLAPRMNLKVISDIGAVPLLRVNNNYEYLPSIKKKRLMHSSKHIFKRKLQGGATKYNLQLLSRLHSERLIFFGHKMTENTTYYNYMVVYWSSLLCSTRRLNTCSHVTLI